MKNYWLVKSEPTTYSWQMFMAEQKTVWSGVRNYQARNNLRAMQLGDLVLFYHSVKQPAVVGVAKVSQEAYQDPTTIEAQWLAVDLEPVTPLASAVTLAQIKANPQLQTIGLLKQSRLSVMPVSADEFAIIWDLAGMDNEVIF